MSLYLSPERHGTCVFTCLEGVDNGRDQLADLAAAFGEKVRVLRHRDSGLRTTGFVGRDLTGVYDSSRGVVVTFEGGFRDTGAAIRWTAVQAFMAHAGVRFDSTTLCLQADRAVRSKGTRATTLKRDPSGSATLWVDNVAPQSLLICATGNNLVGAARNIDKGLPIVPSVGGYGEGDVPRALGAPTMTRLETAWLGAMDQPDPARAAQHILQALVSAA